MASEEPSMNHFVMSPFWITQAVEGETLKRTTPLPDGLAIETAKVLGVDGGKWGAKEGLEETVKDWKCNRETRRRMEIATAELLCQAVLVIVIKSWQRVKWLLKKYSNFSFECLLKSINNGKLIFLYLIQLFYLTIHLCKDLKKNKKKRLKKT